MTKEQLPLFDDLPAYVGPVSKHPLYAVWQTMRRRCADPRHEKFPNYGGRGIAVCAEWQTSPRPFIAWALLNGWQPGLQIDRRDNDGPYSPDNCRFVTLRTVDASPLLAPPGPENPSPVSPGPEKPSPVNQAVKGRISTPAPPENPSPYKDKTRQDRDFAMEKRKASRGAVAAGAALPDPVLALLADALNAGKYVAPSAVSTGKAAALVASGLVSSSVLRSRGIAH